jgi:hypothetical protein
MPSVLVECANILNCSVKQLTDKIREPGSREKLLKKLKGRTCRTTFPDRNGDKYTIFIKDFTKRTSDVLQAYGKKARPFNPTVSQHFYSRHRIRLENPFLPCVIKEFVVNLEEQYYPLELLELIDEKEENECKCTDKFESFQQQIEEDGWGDDDSQYSFCSFCSHYH